MKLCIACGADISKRCNGGGRLVYCLTCTSKMSDLGGAARAWGAVHRAVRNGKLPPAKSCVCTDCGKSARDYDHRDYAKPLEVDPVCRTCNLKRGPGKRNGIAQTPAQFVTSGAA